MDDVRPQNEPQLEDQGIPDHEGPLPSKVRTGAQREGMIPPGTDAQTVDRFGTTAAEQARGEHLSQRLEAEFPDADAEIVRDDPGQMTTTGDAETDDEGTLVATDFEDAPGQPPEDEAVRIVEKGAVPGATDRGDDGYLEEKAG